jgi:hypothetical protein
MSRGTRYPVDATGGGRNCAIIRRISANRVLEITTSAVRNRLEIADVGNDVDVNPPIVERIEQIALDREKPSLGRV